MREPPWRWGTYAGCGRSAPDAALVSCRVGLAPLWSGAALAQCGLSQCGLSQSRPSQHRLPAFKLG